jgi:hypothetical protein
MASPTQFSKRMGLLGTKVAKNADKVVRKVAMAVDRTVVIATPVDTGRARANWIAALDAAPVTATEDKDKSGSKAVSQAAGVVAGYDGDKNAEVHITNNLPYIGRLNEGSSFQAPANFVQTAVKRGVAAVKGAKLLEG